MARFPALLFTAALLPAAARGWDVPPGNPILVLEAASPWSFGAGFGYRASGGGTVTVEGLHRDEVFGSASPSERYDAYTLQTGIIARAGESDGPGFEVGLLAGGGYVRGRVRGKLLDSDPGGCDIWCTGPSSRHESVRLDAPAAVAVLMAGYQGRTFGFGFAPHIYYARRFFTSAPLALRIRF